MGRSPPIPVDMTAAADHEPVEMPLFDATQEPPAIMGRFRVPRPWLFADGSVVVDYTEDGEPTARVGRYSLHWQPSSVGAGGRMVLRTETPALAREDERFVAPPG